MFNKYTIVIANQNFHATQWNNKYQVNFKGVFNYFNITNSESWIIDKARSVARPATPTVPQLSTTSTIQIWYRIIFI